MEWTKNYKIKNGNRPFCFSVVYLAVPETATPVLLGTPPRGGRVRATEAQLEFSWTSVYVEEHEETTTLVRAADAAVRAAFAAADHVTGHQFTSDLGVLAATGRWASAGPLHAVAAARENWLARRTEQLGDRQVVDTRYDTDHVLTGTSRRLVDVCGELRLEVTQPELKGTSMTALHRLWLEKRSAEARERISVLNLRHSLSTALVALRATNRITWTGLFDVNKMLATGAHGAFDWLAAPTFTALLDRKPT
ncbi:hypothetical protein [Saccharothrix xinjiangensis]|uniref:Tyr recombinase domain-containing protein n=1 Tax=Saccharothrix xinjiangensis TaxID=204798 RepID=A0ABV9Y398_9PSEU